MAMSSGLGNVFLFGDSELDNAGKSQNLEKLGPFNMKHNPELNKFPIDLRDLTAHQQSSAETFTPLLLIPLNLERAKYQHNFHLFMHSQNFSNFSPLERDLYIWHSKPRTKSKLFSKQRSNNNTSNITGITKNGKLSSKASQTVRGWEEEQFYQNSWQSNSHPITSSPRWSEHSSGKVAPPAAAL